MKLDHKQKEILNHIGNLQLEIIYTGESSDSEIVRFEFEGMDIVHPLLDETGSYEIDPFEYYGEAFKNSEFVKFI